MIGEGTKKKFPERGIYPDFMPSVYDGNTLGKELGALLNGTEKILIPRASLGNKGAGRRTEKNRCTGG